MAGSRLWKFAALSLALLAAGTTVAWGQTESSLNGAVSDATGSAIAGASISLRNEDTGAVRSTATDAAGHYEAPLLPVGNYLATAALDGFQAVTSKVTLVVGQQATLNFTLAVGGQIESVVVTDQAPAIDVTTTDDSGVVGERQVKDLPLNGRSYDQLLTLNPGVVNYTSQRAGGVGTSNSVVGNIFSASGHRPGENLYLLNGVEFTSASEISNTPGGVSGQLLGVDAVREFSVVTDTYGAEYGKRPGAQVNIVTASGSNQLHGSAYEFVRNSALDSKNFFDFGGSKPPLDLNNFGASLGGPIKKDKSFFFVNYEGFRETDGLSDLTLVPDATSRAHAVASVQPYLALWPIANGPELLTASGGNSGIAEAFSDPTQRLREDFGSARFDQTFSGQDSLAVDYTADDGTANSPTSNPFTVVNLRTREQVASVSETHIFSPSLINRVAFGFSRGAFYFNSGVTVNLPSVDTGWLNAGAPVGALVVGGGTTLNGASQITNGGTNAGSNLTANRNLFTISDQLTLTHGKHLLSWGVWFEPLQANDTLVQDQYGQASFTSLSTFLAGNVSTYTFAPSYTPLNWRQLEGAFFVQDTIKLRPDLEVSLGFRGEFTNGWNEAQGRASNYVFSFSGVIITQPVIGASALAQNNAQFLPEPRAAIAWSPLGSKKTVIRAGFGLYYGLLDNLSYRLDQDPPFNSVYAIKSITVANIPNTHSTTPGSFLIPSGVQPDLQTPTVESYSLKIEQELFPGTTLGVSYIGNHSYHELLSADANLPAAPYPYPTQVVTTTSTGLANPNVWNTTTWFSEGISNYNALRVDVSHRMSHGLQFRGVYNYSKTLDDGDNMNTSVATNSPAFVENPLDPMADYGRASFDVRHSAVINATYALPFARGASPALRRAFADWQISAIETLQSGLPFTPQLSYNPSNDGDTRNPVRPSWNPAFTGNVIEGGPNQYFNPLAFIQPAAGTYGDVGRNILQGPGLATLDVSVAKRFVLKERLSLQFRGEIFNLFNRANFNTPNPVVYTAATPVLSYSPTAGVITSTTTAARQIQFGLKLLW